jgi:hypothetical protein
MGANGMDRMISGMSRTYRAIGKKEIKEIMPDDGLVLLFDHIRSE